MTSRKKGTTEPVFPFEPDENNPLDYEDDYDDLDDFDDDEDTFDDEDELTIPSALPILPLRGLVVYPHTAVPLTVGQPRSLKLIDDVSTGGLIGLFTAQDPELESPGPGDTYQLGTLAQIHRLFRAPDGTVRVLVQGLARIRLEDFLESEPFLRAQVVLEAETVEETMEVEALLRNIVDQFGRLAELVPNIPNELVSSALNMDDPLQTAYSIATYMRISLEESQALLELPSLTQKLHRLMLLMSKELEVLELGRKIQNDAQGEMEKVQREYFLREQLKAIHRELGEEDDPAADAEGYRQRIASVGMSEEARKEAERELDRLTKLPTASAEYGVIRTYLDWLVELPWNERTEDNLDIKNARQVLDEDHYGLEDIKDRIIEFLAVRKLKAERAELLKSNTPDTLRRTREGVILCFVGPPGVGKTSLGASIARALERKFIRMSLGGVRDEAEIRGFRRTYIGAMPGRLIQSLRRIGTNNPIIMLDEVDKLGRDFRGDPASALLEVLDPEQNREFRDHYLDVAFDLSEVMFITTANELDPIPAPLRDRMEVIQLSGYTEIEKIQIACQYLVPRQIQENGLLPDEIEIKEDAIRLLVQDYTHEAGVRNLEREIGRIVRKLATRVVAGEASPFVVARADVTKLLGHPKAGYQFEMVEDRTDKAGVAVGLAWTPMGGDVLFIEALQMPGSKGFQYTGQLGSVMQESARAASSYVRAHLGEYQVAEDYFEKHDIHLHVPAGAIPKDGPSAGVTMTTALVSLLTGRAVLKNIAMTGEITLSGQVLPVGGIKDKVLAADRFGLDTVILPKRNERDLEDLPDEIRQKMKFVLVKCVDEVLEAALSPIPKRKRKVNTAKEVL